MEIEDKLTAPEEKDESEDNKWYYSHLTEDYISQMYMQDDKTFVIEGYFGEGDSRAEAEEAEQLFRELSFPIADNVKIIGGGGDEEEYYTKEEFINDFIGNLHGLQIILKVEDGEFTEIHLCS